MGTSGSRGIAVVRTEFRHHGEAGAESPSIDSVTVLDGPVGPGPFANDSSVASEVETSVNFSLSHGFAFEEINALVLRIEVG